ncbi:hypothetical protein [Micromonospora sp. NPDC005173]|uniref:hypothetical protein n=1 Tax=Micromonospora sp. NPDC005173 TaxID=3157165 RepID=UPI0033B4EDDB
MIVFPVIRSVGFKAATEVAADGNDRNRVVASARAVLPATERRRTDMTTRGFTFVADERHNGARS